MSAPDSAAAKVYAVFGVCGLAIIISGAVVHYQNEPPLPAAPAVEKRPEVHAPDQQMRFGDTFFKTLVTEDARRFGVGANVDTLRQPFPYRAELAHAQRLVGKDGFSTAHLEIQAKIEKQWTNTGGGQGFGADQFLLVIKNKTSSYLAYRIDTEVPDPKPCRAIGAVPHNAVALRPHEEISRAECLWGRGFFLMVNKVEVMEIPSLSFYYLSRLHPPHALYQRRPSEGHQPPMGKLCEHVPWRDIEAEAEAGQTGWADVIDFYGRHNCDEYDYFRGYRRRKSVAEPLPARAGAPSEPGSVTQK